jgi:hypothetical protein
VFLGASNADPAPMLAAVSAAPAGFVPGIDLLSGRVRLVRAHRAFPVLRRSPPRPYRVPCGTGAGLSWEAALTRALVQHCLRLTVAGRFRRSHLPVDLAVADFTQDRTVEYCRVMLDAAGLDVVLRDVTGPLGVPVVACTADTVGTVHGCGADRTQAVRDALLALLLRHQCGSDSRLASVIARTPLPLQAGGAPDAPPMSPDAVRLTAALARMGHLPVVFALDHDPALRRVMPFALRVVLEASDA